MKLYRIIDTATGLFSTGGMSPKWTKNGKLWTIHHLRQHLRQFDDYHWPYPNTIRAIEYSVAEVGTIDLRSIMVGG